MKRILVINPGSTSTKLAVYEDLEPVWKQSVFHPAKELARFHHINEQYEYRRTYVLEALQKADIPMAFDAIIARGGILKPTQGGVYRIDERMKHDLWHAPMEHASNLAALLADEFAKDIKEDLLANADASYHTSLSTNYHYPFTGYAWGSNAYVADDISLMMIAYRISGLSRYQESAISEMNYILGLNPLDMCFVTGYGYNYPQDIHHRITMANGLAEKGLMVGGVDEIMSDGNLSSFISEDTPRAKRYVDNHESYSTNEVATYYNSALFLALSFFKDLS